MTLSELLESMTPDGRVTVSDDWRQGRSVFGGLQGALAAHVMRRLVPAVPLRALQISFIAPLPAGPVRLRAQVLRMGKSVTHVEARVHHGDELTTIAVGVFGARRPSRVVRTPVQPPLNGASGFDVHPVPGLLPEFLQHFDMRWLDGPTLFSGSSQTRTVLGVGLKDSGPTGEAQVIAISDVPPPVALSMLDAPAVGSSLTWVLEFLRDRVGDLPLAGWRLDSELVAGRDGYTSQSVMVWGPGGEPVALSRQSMVVFG